MDVSPNVVTEETLRGLLAEGYVLEVGCKDGAEKRHNSWYGSWVIRALLPDGSSPKALVTSRRLFKPREFKTIVGLVSFLADMGCKTACIPLEQGATERHVVLRQARILVKAAKEAAQFCCRRASVTLDTLADETKPLQCHAGQIDAFNANF